MIDPQKCRKLVQLLERLILTIENNNERTIHFTINQFFYMQRAEEIRMVLEQYEEARMKLEAATNWLNENYASTYHQWRKDARWLNTYLRNRNNIKSIL